MIRRLGIGFLILLFSLQAKAKAMETVISHTLFYAPSPTGNGQMVPEIETYWQVNQRTVHYTTNAAKMIIARIKADIVFLNDSGIISKDSYILQTIPRSDIKELSMNKIIDLKRYTLLSAGVIRMRFVLTDMADSTNKFVYTDSFMIAPPVNDAFYSGIELLDTTIESPVHTAFEKNGHQQIPNCSNFIDEQRKFLHYYAELYGTNKISKEDLPLIQKIRISKNENDYAYDNIVKTDTITTATILPIAGTFSIAAQPSGNYYLVMSLENNTHQVIASKNFFFQRLNPNPEKAPETAAAKNTAINDTGLENINVVNLNKTFVAKYDLSQVKAILRMLLPFSDNSAKKTIDGFLKKPDEMYMRYYIYNYFLNINRKEPGKAWKEFSEKILEVNKLFSVHGTPGYQTDRGYMYLKYGSPTEVVTVENEQGALPYEIWQYNTLVQMNKKSIPNAVFLFYRPDEVSHDFKLLHTNVTGEVQNAAWKSYLYINSSAGTTGNSRAEEFLQH